MKNFKILERIKKLHEEVSDGNICPMNAYVMLKEIEDYLTGALSSVRDTVLNNPRFSGRETVMGYELSRKIVVRYDYDGIDTIKSIEDDLKRAKEIAKIGGVHPDTGELMQAKKIETETLQLKKIKS